MSAHSETPHVVHSVDFPRGKGVAGSQHSCAPPAGQHSCQPTAKFHMLPMAWIHPHVGKGVARDAGCSSWHAPYKGSAWCSWRQTGAAVGTHLAQKMALPMTPSFISSTLSRIVVLLLCGAPGCSNPAHDTLAMSGDSAALWLNLVQQRDRSQFIFNAMPVRRNHPLRPQDHSHVLAGAVPGLPMETNFCKIMFTACGARARAARENELSAPFVWRRRK